MVLASSSVLYRTILYEENASSISYEMMPVGQAASVEELVLQLEALSRYSGVNDSAEQRVDNLLSVPEAFPSIALDVATGFSGAAQLTAGLSNECPLTNISEVSAKVGPLVNGKTLNLPGSGTSANMPHIYSEESHTHPLGGQSLQQPDFAVYSAFSKWVQGCDRSPFGDLHFMNDYLGPEYIGDVDKNWVVHRDALSAYATISLKSGDSVKLPLDLSHISLVSELTARWQQYYDFNILAFPRRAKLLDRLLIEVSSTPADHLVYDFWGACEEPRIVRRDSLLLILAYLEAYGPYATYASFEKALEDAYVAVYHDNSDIVLQCGEVYTRKKVSFSKLRAENQQREFSVRQMMRVRREVIQRAKAAERVAKERQRIPRKERAKQRDVLRKALRELKELNIESQSGIIDYFKAPIKTVGDMMEMPANINRACESINNAVNETSDNVSSISEVVVGSANYVNETLQFISDSLKDMKRRMIDIIPKVLVTTILVGFLYFVYNKFTSPLLKAAILGLIVPLVGESILKDIIEFFKEDNVTDTSEPNISQQSGLLDTAVISKLVAATLMGAVFNARRPSSIDGLTQHMLSSMVSVPRAMKGVESFIDTIVSLTEFGVNAIRSWFNKPPLRFANKFASAIGDLADRIHDFIHKDLTGETGLDAHKRYTKLMAFHFEVTTQLQIHGANKDVRQELNTLKALVLKHAHPLRHLVGNGAGYRVQPASVIISGLPGIGKTTIVQSFAMSMMKLTGDMEDNADEVQAEQAVFTKPANSPYMDGYQDQYCFLIDDLFAIKPTPNLEGNSFADIMALYGGFTTMLNMAECDKKGMFPFTSKLLLMTTNAKSLKETNISQILIDESAFRRRIDFHVLITVKKEFRKAGSHELDYAKYVKAAEQGDGLDRVPWHVWEYYDTTFDGPDIDTTIPGKPMKELLIRVAERIRLNKLYHGGQQALSKHICNAKITPDWTFASIQSQSGLDVEITPEEEGEDGLPELESCEPSFYSVAHSDDPVVTYKTEDTTRSRWHSAREAWNRNFKTRIIDALGASMTEGYTMGLTALAPLVFALPLTALGFGVVVKSAISFIAKMCKSAYNWFKEMIFGKKKEPDISAQSNMPKPRVVRFLAQQSGGNVPMLWNLVYNNTFKAAIDLGDSYGVLGQILFLKNNFAVMPAHFIKQIQQHLDAGKINRKTLIKLRGCKQERLDVDVSVDAFLSYDRRILADRDLCFINFAHTLRPRKDILDKILRKSEIDDIGGSTVRLDTARMDRKGVFVEYNDRETFISPSVTVGKSPIRIGNADLAVVHNKWLRYDAQTLKGDCGAVLSVTDHSPYSCRLVAGLHVGYDEEWGKAYATPIDFETCKEMAASLGVIDVPEAVAHQCGWSELGITTEPLATMPFTDGDTKHFGSFEPLMKATPGVNMVVKSNLVKTSLGKQEFFKKEIAAFYDGTEPDELEVMKLGHYHDEEGVKQYPMADAMRPFSGGVRIINQKDFSVAVGVAMKPFNDASVDVSRRVLSFEEAVIGVPALGLKSIARQTSVGFPWVIKTSDKKYFFGSNSDFDLAKPEAIRLKEEVLELEKLLKSGVRPMFVCRDFLKDEVRKKGKKARLIAGTDIRYYILCRMYYGAYVAAHMRLHRVSGICTGMNQYSEWQGLLEHITRPGKNVWDGDFAGFDSSQQPSMLWTINDQINDWYSRGGMKEDNPIRDLLFMDLAHSRHITTLDGTATSIIEWQKSLPSGHFLTSIINSILSMAFIVSAFIALTGLLDFWKHASVATQGDDNICSVSDEYLEVFNQIAVADYLQETFGMTYTAGRKGEELRESMSVDEIIFLQRRFAWKNGCVVCPIRPESFLHNIYYTKKGTQTYRDGVVVGCIEDALQELAMHSEEMWPVVAPRLVEALALYGKAPTLPTHDSSAYFQLVRQRVPEWQ